jgi:predicted RNase H-like HicB family nuclease/DNA-binding XRE family transcriptional regulator
LRRYRGNVSAKLIGETRPHCDSQMEEIRYPALIHREAHGLTIEIPDLGFAARGDSVSGCLETAQEAIGSQIESIVSAGLPVPRPGRAKGQDVYLIAPEPRFQAGLLLRFAREDQRLSQAEFAERLGIAQRTYSDMENLRRTNLTLKKLAELAGGLGKRAVIRFEERDRPRVRLGRQAMMDRDGASS